MTKKRITFPVVMIVVVAVLLAPITSLAYDWQQFGGNPSHSGNNSSEVNITRANLGSMELRFQVNLPEATDGTSAYLSNVTTPGGVHNLLFVTTKAGRLVALDASSGQQIWTQQADTQPQFTTSSPAVDTNGKFVYSYGLDGYVHKYQVGDGAEVKDDNWPELATLKPELDKESSSLSIATARSGVSYLYVTTAGFAEDVGDYQGHITTINLTDGSQHVFNAVCSDQPVHFVTDGTPDCSQQQAGIWARAGVVYDPETDRIYAVTGNGDYSGDKGGYDWGDTVLALNPDGTAPGNKPLDSYTPTNYQELADEDQDLGSSSLVILPTVAGSKYPHLAVVAGKDANLRLINLDDMSGQSGAGHLGGELQVVHLDLGGAVLPTPAVWRNPADGSDWLFVTNYGSISGWQLTLAGGQPKLAKRWSLGPNGSSPIVANGILYCASSNKVYALDPTSGQPLWQATDIGTIHWQSVVVANGALYIADEEGHLTAYTPNGVDPTTLSAPNSTATPDTSSHNFTETGHTVSGKFWQYWQANGGLARFGYPISDLLTEVSALDGKSYQVQYFERAEFELHPENQPPYDVLLTQLGTLLYQQHYPNGTPAAQASADNAYLFNATGKTVGGSFRAYWEAYGGLAQFGFPISDQFQEQSTLDGKTYTVQYFERAEFEYHPENAGTQYEVQLGQLGTLRYQQKYANG